jgi:S-(hydroxymethyl)glutathione dehydrogenase/alcohol dehydrogenase
VVEEVGLRRPGPGEVEVRLAASAICHSDIHYMDGAWGGVLPAVYGHEAAGEVVAVGAGVEDLALGTPVVVTLIRACGHCVYCGRGEETACEDGYPPLDASPLRTADGAILTQGMATAAFAERVVVNRSQVVALPASVPFASAALLACGVLTGVGAVLNTARVPAGASVAVIGAGGVGLNVVQGARLAGAAPIVALDPQPGKRATALAMGATAAFDPLIRDPEPELRALTGGRGADFVFVSIGSKSAIENGLRLLAKGAALVVLGMPATGVTVELDPTALAANGQRVLGSRMGSSRIARDIPLLVDHYRRGQLKLDELVSGRYPLAAINEAIAEVRQGAALRNVIVF